MGDTQEISIQVNGQKAHCPPHCTLAAYLALQKLDPKTVVVELNGVILAPASFAQSFLSSGDVLEIIHFVGGG